MVRYQIRVNNPSILYIETVEKTEGYLPNCPMESAKEHALERARFGNRGS